MFRNIRSRLGSAVCLGVVVLGMPLATATPARAVELPQLGQTFEVINHFGDPNLGSVVVDVSVDAWESGQTTGTPVTAVRSYGWISARDTKTYSVQLDKLVLEAGDSVLDSTATPVNSGPRRYRGRPVSIPAQHGAWISNELGCTVYFVRAYFSIQWIDGGLSGVEVLTPPVDLCRWLPLTPLDPGVSPRALGAVGHR